MTTGNQDFFSFYSPTRIVHGADSSTSVGNIAKSLLITKAFLVTDKGVNNAGLLDGILESLRSAKIDCVVFDDVEQDPCRNTVSKGAEIAVKEKCDGVVVVGGGSPLCAGRGIGLMAKNEGDIIEYAGFRGAPNPPLPVIAIPTTAGSGAEVSQVVVLKDEEKNAKFVVASPSYYPKVAILDPKLMRTLPFWQSVISGVDALSHAIESYLTTMSTPITEALALAAVGKIFQNLRTAATTNDLKAKEECMLASTMANIACGNSRLGLAHTMSEAVEGLFEVSHGLSIGILLPHVMEFNLPASHQRFIMLAKSMGEPEKNWSIAEYASRAVYAVKELLIDLDFPRKYTDSRFDKKDIRQLAKMNMAGLYDVHDSKIEYSMDDEVPSVNIRKATLKNVIDLYEKSLTGWEK